MSPKNLLLPSLALGGAVLLLGPAPGSPGYTLLGDDLSLAQRDFRVYDNFSKAITNDNVTPDDNFPGHLGADMAIWKACIEWSSRLHGAGNGDPTQPGGLGSGGANFDPSWQGNAAGIGTSSNNIHSQISGSSGGVLAYCETGFGGAWRIRYYEGWNWDDGPEALLGGVMDLQGIACHEYGHALGLGHSSVGTATMYPTASGTGSGQRSIDPDDAAGIQAIYGKASAAKPRVHSIDVGGGAVTIHGQQFSPTSNEVWFTNASVTSTGANPFVKVTGVASTGGGTQISVTVPAAAGAGDLLVRNSGTTHSSLSNAWPFDPAGNPPPPTLTGLAPGSIAVVSPAAQELTVTGNHLDTAVAVRVGGVAVDFHSVSPSELSCALPGMLSLGTVQVEVDTLYGTGQLPLGVVPNDPPALIADTAVLIVGQPAQFTVGSAPGNVVFIAASPSLSPSILPGIITADIGAGFTALTLVDAPVIDASGKAVLAFPTGGLPSGSSLHFQAAAYGGAFPLVVSEVETLFFL